MSSFSLYKRQEIIRAANVPWVASGLLSVNCMRQFTERRLFLYLEVNRSAVADFKLLARVQCWNEGELVAEYPASIADLTNTTEGESVESVFVQGGSPVGDSLVLRLRSPFDAAVPAVTVQPLRLSAEITRVELDIIAIQHTTVTGFRAYLGVLSSKPL